MKLLAIDPGPEESAMLVYDTDERSPEAWAKLGNGDLRAWIRNLGNSCHEMAIEHVASYGMPVGAETFSTCIWVGRFIERRVSLGHPEPMVVYRLEVKEHICKTGRKVTDAHIRQALIDRYGGRDKAIGRKATPGPLYGISGDVWSALAVAITAAERPA